MTGPAQQIQIERDGPTFRVVVPPPDALPANWSRPKTYASHPIACLGAKLIGEVLGLPVIDLTRVDG
jgi:hypothetical protein